MNKHHPLPPDARVTLVGAGPGDPDLLTLKAVKAIERASVLLVDDLVSPDIVALAAPTARVIHVGKRGGCKSTPQAFIEKLMIAAVREGERVVRLKGGDPLVFGRAGEEIEHLRAEGIEVDIVPGISAAQAAAASLGVSLTHRDHAHGVLWLTGHAKPGGNTSNWQTIGFVAHEQGLTLAVYMGRRRWPVIRSGLLVSMPASTPVAVVERASQPGEQRRMTTLDSSLDAWDEASHGPAIVLIGPAVAMSADAFVSDMSSTLGRVVQTRTTGAASV